MAASTTTLKHANPTSDSIHRAINLVRSDVATHTRMLLSSSSSSNTRRRMNTALVSTSKNAMVPTAMTRTAATTNLLPRRSQACKRGETATPTMHHLITSPMADFVARTELSVVICMMDSKGKAWRFVESW
ncbi:hypothetical protein DOTSEDRAFT_68135 [Dothistroma septosporum NZE10]|uniref:Uncharacterized protein n=1 Tax=Dothistroma septosporum (strain NZE10 / CBS 128990) TaxID=675120 RepID=N1Q0R8_DOTSN|nr:hypothetical protein DOTSEDRAFT_68135 [Dothistroma septosporum NZE10]